MNRIVVLMTPSHGSRMALDEAIKLATESGGVVGLVRILGASRSIAGRTRAETWLTRMRDAVPEAARGGADILFGPPGITLQRAVEAHVADTVIIGARAYGALLRIGVDESFVENVGPKLLIVRPNAEPAMSEVASTAPSRSHDRHPLLEVMTLTGAATGAVAGAIAGPPGALAGAAIGSAVGLLAGTALERSEDATAAHDQALDDEIVVTQGTLGLGGLVIPSGSLVAPEDTLATAPNPGGGT
jgi:nucleotide-binding universal stress UspA family protein